MSVKTFFQSAEAIAKRTFGGVVSAETWAAPMAEKVFPGYAGLIAFATDELATLKAVTSSAGTGAMTDEQTVAALLGTIEPAVQQWAGSTGIPAPAAADRRGQGGVAVMQSCIRPLHVPRTNVMVQCMHPSSRVRRAKRRVQRVP